MSSTDMDRKKLLIYAHYYVPDVASTGQILRELAEGMLDTFDITVICVVPSYGGIIEDKYKIKKFYIENINGVKVVRVRVPEYKKGKKLSRIKNIISYFNGALAVTKKLTYQDYVFAISQPPILGGVLGVFSKELMRRKYHSIPKFIYNIQDFNPEQIMAIGYFQNRILLNLILAVDKQSCQRSDLIITVGRDLLETIHKRFMNYMVPKTIIINNWINEKEIYPLSADNKKVLTFKEKYGLVDKFTIMYSGNIGLYYDLENLIGVVERFRGRIAADGKEVMFAFVGAGSVSEILKNYVKQHYMDNVVFIPYQKKEELIYSLNAADVHWCVNAKGIKGVSCPSKYYGIAAVGKPVIGVLEKGSEIRCIIEETKSGLVCEPGDYENIEKNISWFLEHAGSEDMLSMGQRGRSYLLKKLTKDVSVEKYKKAILES